MIERGIECYWENKECVVIWDYGNGYCEIKEKNGREIQLVKKTELHIKLIKEKEKHSNE